MNSLLARELKAKAPRLCLLLLIRASLFGAILVESWCVSVTIVPPASDFPVFELHLEHGSLVSADPVAVRLVECWVMGRGRLMASILFDEDGESGSRGSTQAFRILEFSLTCCCQYYSPSQIEQKRIIVSKQCTIIQRCSPHLAILQSQGEKTRFCPFG